MIWRMRQEQEFQKSRSILQALLLQQDSKEKAELVSKSFDMLREAFFPFDKRRGDAEILELRKHLMKEMAKGPVQVVSMDLRRGNRNVKRFQKSDAISRRPSNVLSG